MVTTAQEETRRALETALIDLLSDRGMDGISVRDVAAEAGVNHGLVHRYYGSKEGLVRAAVARVSRAIHEGDPGDGLVSAWSFDYLRRRPELAIIVARTCLDGPHDLLLGAAPDRERLESIVAPVRRALARFGLADQVDAYVLNALATVTFLGWFVFRPLLDAGFGLPADADEQVAALSRRLDTFLAA